MKKHLLSSKAIRLWPALLLFLVALAPHAHGEGSKNLTPNTAGTSTYPYNSVSWSNASNKFVGFLQTDDNNILTGGQNNSRSFMKPMGPYLTAPGGLIDGAAFDANERLFVHLKKNEVLYYGLHRNQAGANIGRDLVVTVRYGTGVGTIGKQTTLLTTGTTHVLQPQAGVINTPAEATAGPKRNGFPVGGYNPLVYTNTTGAEQDFWIELNQVDETGGTLPAMTGSGAKRSFFDIWDFTVKDQAGNTFLGRLFSKAWSFTGAGSPAKLSSTFNIYPLIPDVLHPGKYFVKRWFLGGLDPYGVIFRCNSYGADTTFGTDFRQRRKSRTVDNSYAEYKIFVSNPDPNIYPSTTVPYFQYTSSSYCNYSGVGGNAVFTFNVSEPGIGTVAIDLDNVIGYQETSTKDVLIQQEFLTAGYSTVLWNGLDKAGNVVPSNKTIKMYFRSTTAAVHFPEWDAEYNIDGFQIQNVRPGTSNAWDLLYWDDSLITDATFTPKQSLLGTPSSKGVHRWGAYATGTTGNNQAGNNVLVNTWAYGALSIDSLTGFYVYVCDRDGDGYENDVDIDDDNDGITDLTESGGVDPLVLTASNIPRYLDAAYVHPIFGVYRDVNKDGVNDVFDNDLDGIINEYDADSDGDGLPDAFEANNYVTPANFLASNGTISGLIDANGMPQAAQTTSGSGVSIFANPNTDGDIQPNFLDYDSDNDGINDLREAQTTAAYRAPLGTDADKDGIDDRFDPVCAPCGTAGTALSTTLSDKDGDGTPDLKDLDSDNDLSNDWLEGFDDNHDGYAKDDLLKRRLAFITAGGLATTYPLTDANANGIPDFMEDANNNGTPNFLDPTSTYYVDANANGIADLFDAATGSFGKNSTAPKRTVAQADADFRYNSFTGGVQLDSKIDYAVTNVVSTAGPYYNGQPVTYTIKVKNRTGVIGHSITILDSLLTSKFTIVSRTPSRGTYVGGYWNIDSIAGGDSVSLVIVARPIVSGSLSTTASLAASGETDTLASNNSQTNTITVLPALDIVVTNVAGPGPYQIGDNVVFTISATNSGPSAATGLSLTDLLPSGLTFVSATPDAGTTYNSTTGLWTIGNLGVGVSDTLYITASPIANATYATTASLTTVNENDNLATNNSATASIKVDPVVDLGVILKATAGPYTIGTNVTYTLKLFNNGPGRATNAQVAIALPYELSYLSYTSALGTYDTATTLWSGITLNAGDTTTLTFVAAPNAIDGIPVVATVQGADQYETNPANNSATLIISTNPPDVAVTITPAAGPYYNGKNIAFVVQAKNLGTGTAQGVVLAAPLPTGFTYVSAGVGVGSYNTTTRLWTIGNILPGDSAKLTLTLKPTTAGILTDSAYTTNVGPVEYVTNNNVAAAPVTVLPTADISVAISGTVTAGLAKFTIIGTNIGPDVATGVQITDLLSSNFSYSSYTSTKGAYNPTTGVWSPGTIAVGAKDTLILYAYTTGTGSISSTATKTGGNEYDPVSANNTATFSVTGTGYADLSTTTTVSSGPFYQGVTNATYTVTVTNNGPGNANAVTVTDKLPTGMTFVSSLPAQGTYNSGTGVWSVGALANGASTTLQLVGTPTATGTIVNGVTAKTQTETDPVVGNNLSSVSITVLPVADVQVLKTVALSTIVYNGSTTFTVTAKNLSTVTAASGVVLSDLLPTGLTYVSNSPASGTTYDPITGVWTIGAIPISGSKVITITVKGTTPGTFVNTATKTAQNEADFTTNNDAASATLTVSSSADISINNTVNIVAPQVGGVVTFTVTATNVGPSPATGVKVTDLLPSGLSFVAATTTGGTYTSATGLWDLSSLTIPSSGVYTLYLTASATSTGTIATTATKTAQIEADPNTINDVKSVSVTPVATASTQDIQITKVASVSTVSQGGTVTYTITCKNAGTANATNVNVEDLLPTGMTYVSHTSPVGTYSPTTGLWTIGTIGTGITRTLTITATATGTGAIVNTAYKASQTENDAVTSNNTASATVTVGPVADIAVTNTASASSVNTGATVTFTVTSTNNGPSTANNVAITDLLPSNYTLVSATPSQGSYNTTSGVWTIGTQAVSNVQTLTLVATATTAGTANSTATKTAETETDNTPANNAATANVTINAVSTPADIAVTNVFASGPYYNGQPTTITVTATNNGPNGATGVSISDVLPSGLTLTSNTPSQGTYNSTTGVWTVGNIANGANATLTLNVTPNTTGTIATTATKTAQGESDPVSSNNTASNSISVGGSADIQITNTPNVSTSLQGGSVVFSVKAKNNGPNTATNVVVQDLLPAGFTYVSSTTASGTYDPGTGNWTVGTVTNGATASLSITATAALSGTQSATATKTGLTEFDPVTSNDAATATVTVTAVADIAVTNTPSTAPGPGSTYYVGQPMTFTVTVTNNGPGAASNVLVNDLLPTGLTFTSYTASQGTYNSASGQWNVGSLAIGASRTLTITATPGTAATYATNVTKSQTETDNVLANNTAAATISTSPAADIQVTNTVNTATPVQGANVIFTVKAKNNGPSSATGVQITDLLPAGLTFVSATPGVGTYNSTTGVWDMTGVTTTSGTTQTLTLTAQVTGTGTLNTTASRTAGTEFDAVSSNNSASVSVTPTYSADVAVAITASVASCLYGDTYTYQIVASNNGYSTANGVVLNDVLPTGVAYLSYTSTRGTYNNTTGNWSLASVSLPPGTLDTLTITVRANTVGNVSTTVVKTAQTEPDPVSSNNSASAVVAINGVSDIAVSTFFAAGPYYQGTSTTMYVVAKNNGPNSVATLTVNDAFPAGFTFQGSTATNGSYNKTTGVWTIGNQASGISDTLLVTLKPSTTGTLTNNAALGTHSTTDNVAANNTASASINVVGTADIGVTIGASATTVTYSSPETFTVTVFNNGPVTATGVVVNNLVPAGFTLVSSTPAQGTYNATTGDWTIGTMANGASTTLVLATTATTVGTYTSTANKTAANEVDLVSSNNSAAVSVVVTPSADVAITNVPSTTNAVVGQTVTFTVTATDNGPNAVTNLTVTDLLPSGFTLVSATAGTGTTYNSSTGQWVVGTLALNGASTLILTATATTVGTFTSNAGVISQTEPDPVVGNNSQSATVVVAPVADIAVATSVNNATPYQGQNVTYTVTATNNGPNTATGVSVNDLLPAGLTFVSATAPSGTTYDATTGNWTIGTLGNSSFKSLTIVATPTATGTITTTSTKTAENEYDGVSANNSASVAINVSPAADVAVAITPSAGPYYVNQNVTYTVIATNNGPSTATNVALTQALPTGMSYVSSNPLQGTYNSATNVWSVGTIANGASDTLYLVLVPTTATTKVVSTTKTAATETDAVSANNTASTSISVNPAADIAVTNVPSSTTVNQGQNVTFTVKATNNGLSNATNVLLNDLLPAGFTYVSSSAPAGTTYNPTTGDWNVGSMIYTQVKTLTITATATTVGAFADTAMKVSATEYDPIVANNQAIANVTVNATADVAVAISPSATSLYNGQTVTFTVTASNNGPSNATNVDLTQVLPAGLTFVSANPAQGTYNSATGVWSVGSIANGANTTLTLVAQATSIGTKNTTTAKTAETEYDNVSANNMANTTVTVLTAADIAVTNTVNTPNVNIGSNATFTITATNLGPNNATGLALTDLLPAGLTFVSASAPSGTTYNSSTGVWTIGNLTAAGAKTLTVVATVTSPGAKTTTASLSALNETDLVASNNSATATVTGNPAADIAVATAAPNPTYTVGVNGTLTITASNNGPSTGTGVALTIALPVGVSYVSNNPAQGTYDNSTGIWTVGTLANSASTTLTLTIVPTTPGSKTETATKTAANEFDAVAVNNAASAIFSVGAAADVAVTNTVSNATPNQGTNVTYTVTATNNGPNNATGVSISDALPAGLTFVSATPAQGTYNSATGVWTVGSIANGASTTLTLIATAGNTGTYATTATKTAMNEYDAIAANDTARNTITVAPTGDVAVAVSASAATVANGQTLVFTYTASNNGPSNATGVALTQMLPSGFTYVSSNPAQGTYNSTTGVWTVGSIANGANTTMTITATANTVGSYTASTAKTAENEFDNVAANNTASINVAVTATADIAVTNTAGTAPYTNGVNTTFTITATNNGPNAATGVATTYTLPAGLTYVSASAGQGTYNGATGVWSIGGLANGASATLTITVLPTTTGNLTTTATKTALNEFDAISANDTARATITIAPAADVAVTNTVSNATPNQGTNVTYTVTATNNGPNNATGVSISDALPAGLTFVSATPAQGTYNSATGVWTVGSIANGANTTLTLIATAGNTGTYATTATKTAMNEYDAIAANDTARNTITVAPAADIAVATAAPNPTYTVGVNGTLTITASNNGPSTATGVAVTYTLPSGFTYVSNTLGQGTYNSSTGIWTVGTLANGASTTLTLTATPTTPGTRTATAIKTALNQYDAIAANDTARATLTIGSAAEVAVALSASTATPTQGNTLTLTYTATNNGPNSATGVNLSAILPAGLTYVSNNLAQGTYNSSTGTWNVGTLANGASTTLTLTATATGTGSITATAIKTAMNEYDAIAANDTARTTLTIGASADVAITLTHAGGPHYNGQPITYTATVTNFGPGSATNIAAPVSLPAGFTYVSSNPAQGTYNNATGTWTVGTLANGASTTLTLIGKPNAAGLGYANAASQTHTEPDAVAANNSAADVLDVLPASEPAVAITFYNGTYSAGQTIEMSIAAHNNGLDTAMGVIVRDTIPTNFTFNRFGNPNANATYDPTTRVVTWIVGKLANNQPAGLHLFLNVITAPAINMHAYITSETYDSVLANNHSMVPMAPGALPVTLLSFTAKDLGESIGLNWATASELNAAYFAVERAGEDGTFRELLRVDAAGNSNQLRRYNATDFAPLMGTSLYRLRQVDFDGRTAYTPAVRINRNVAFTLEAYPNPTSGTFTLHAQGLPANATLRILDASGRTLRTFTLGNTPGTVNTPLDLTGFQSGLYTVQVAAQGITGQLRIAKTE